MKEKGAMKVRVSQFKGIEKLTRLGSSPPMEAMSMTTKVMMNTSSLKASSNGRKTGKMSSDSLDLVVRTSVVNQKRTKTLMLRKVHEF